MLEIFLSKLKEIRIIFDRDVSEINKNVSKVPVTSNYPTYYFGAWSANQHIGDEVLDALNKRYVMGIKKQDFKMEQSLDTIGEHYIQASFNSE